MTINAGMSSSNSSPILSALVDYELGVSASVNPVANASPGLRASVSLNELSASTSHGVRASASASASVSTGLCARSKYSIDTNNDGTNSDSSASPLDSASPGLTRAASACPALTRAASASPRLTSASPGLTSASPGLIAGASPTLTYLNGTNNRNGNDNYKNNSNFSSNSPVATPTGMYLNIFIHVYMYIFVFTCICVCIYTYMYMNV
jgi:hypothetical protein